MAEIKLKELGEGFGALVIPAALFIVLFAFAGAIAGSVATNTTIIYNSMDKVSNTLATALTYASYGFLGFVIAMIVDKFWKRGAGE